MTTWNHRVMNLREENNGEDFFQIHEVYYDELGALKMYTERNVGPVGETLEVLRKEITKFAAALDKPVLTPSDFPHSLKG